MSNLKSNPARTVLTISTGFLVIFFLTEQKWPLYVSLILGVTGVFSGYLSALIDKLWMKLAMVLGLIIPRFILLLVFYLVLYPISLLSRLFGRQDFLSLKNRKTSQFVITNKEFNKSSFEKMW